MDEKLLTLVVYSSCAFLYRHDFGDLEPEARFFVSGYTRWQGELFEADFNEEAPSPIRFVAFHTLWDILRYCETAATWHGCELQIQYA